MIRKTRDVPKTRDIITAGAWVRRDVRAVLNHMGCVWSEHKGLLDSRFVVTWTGAQRDTFNRWSRALADPRAVMRRWSPPR